MSTDHHHLLDPPDPDMRVAGSNYLSNRSNDEVSNGSSITPSFYEMLDEPVGGGNGDASSPNVERSPSDSREKDSNNEADQTMMSTEFLMEKGVLIPDALPVVEPITEHNDNDDEDIGEDSNSDDDPPEKKDIISKKYARNLQLASILFFVLGSILYLVCAILDYQWAQELQTLPVWLRTADDDVAWMNYRIEERYNSSSSSVLFNRRSIRRLKKFSNRERLQLKLSVEGEKKVTKEELIVPHDIMLGFEEKDGILDQKATEEPAVKAPIQTATTGATNNKSSSRRRHHRRLETIDPEEPYEDLDWEELPPEIQSAYITLGYNQAIWCEDGDDLLVYTVDWAELTEEQREAVILIGYTQEIWCMETPQPIDFGAVVVPTMLPTRKPVTASPTASPSTVPTMRPVTNSPTSLPTQKPVTGSPTKRPTSKPIEAAAAATNTTIGELVSLRQWWPDFDPSTQSLYVSLGYDEQAWNNGRKVAVDYQSWDEMDFVERLALFSLGYTEESWNAIGPGEHFPSQPSWPTPSPSTVSPSRTPTLKPVTTGSPSKQPSTPKPVTESPSRTPTLKPVTTDSPSKQAATQKPVTEIPMKLPTVVPAIESPMMEPETQSPTKQPVAQIITTQPDPSSVMPTPDDLYNDEWWVDLPVEIQDAYKVLGYNEQMWNDGMEPDSNELDWDELSPEMQEAAGVIGYTSYSWDTEEGEDINEPSMKPTANPTKMKLPSELYYDKLWADLPMEIQEAYTILGYNDVTWDAGVEPISNYLAWEGLTSEEKEAALFIGYTVETWEFDNKVPTVKPTVKPTMKPSNTLPITNMERVEAGYYDDFDWVELPTRVQEAAIVLGYDQRLWDIDGVGWSEPYQWVELPPEAKEAAAILGYDQQSWDGEGDGKDSTELGFGDYMSYDDDYVFQVGALGGAMVWVSQYQIIFFFAALCFVLVGLLDLVRERRAFHVMMILAGIFGVVSSVYVEEDIYLSNVFNCVSVHLFFLEGVTLFGEHKRGAISTETSNLMKWSVMIADLEFAAGALIDVIVSYVFLFDAAADWDISLMITGIFAAVLWLHCSLIYMGLFFFDDKT